MSEGSEGSEGQSGSGLEPGGVDPATESVEARRPAVDPAALLLAVERVAADVAALGRALAAQPEEVAARLDVDAATAAIGVRVGALGSALDQLRLSLLAALDRAGDRFDAPPWLPALQAAIDALAPSADVPEWLTGVHLALTDLGSRLDAPAWLPDLRAALEALQTGVTRLADDRRLDAVAAMVARLAEDRRVDELTTTVARLADDQRLDHLTTTVARLAEDQGISDLAAAVAAADPGERLTRVELAVAELADGVRAGAAVADALDHLGQRLVAIEGAADRVATDARLLVERVAPVPDRLSAIASQVDRITPLARAGDQAGTLFDRLDRVGSELQEAITLLQPRAAVGGDDGDLDERFDGVIDVLAGVARRQDQVTSAITAVVDQVRGPRGVDAVFERMEQRERSLAARLDRIDSALRGRGDAGLGSAAESQAKPDAETARTLETVAAAVEQQERALTLRLDQIEGALQRVTVAAAAPGGAGADAGGDAGGALGAVLERMDHQEQTVASHLDWVAERLSEVAAHLVPERAAAAAAERDSARFDALAEQVGALARRQDDLVEALAGAGTAAPGPASLEAMFDRLEQRERSMAARLDRIDRDLRLLSEHRPPRPPRPAEGDPAAEGAFQPVEDGAAGLAASVEAIASITEDLARLVESTADRLDRRLARVESSLEAVAARPQAAPAPRPSASTEKTALRLAQLRAERAQVQARLQEERLLAKTRGET